MSKGDKWRYEKIKDNGLELYNEAYVFYLLISPLISLFWISPCF